MNGEAMPKCQTEKPTFLHPKLNRIPDELCDFNNWVVWKAVFKDGKWTKVPFNPKNGKQASSTDPATWGGIDSVSHALGGGGYDGIGFMLLEDNQIIGIDLDHCRDQETGDVEDCVALLRSSRFPILFGLLRLGENEKWPCNTQSFRRVENTKN